MQFLDFGLSIGGITGLSLFPHWKTLCTSHVNDVVHVADMKQRSRMQVAFSSIIRKLFGYSWKESVTELQHILGRLAWEQLTANSWLNVSGIHTLFRVLHTSGGQDYRNTVNHTFCLGFYFYFLYYYFYSSGVYIFAYLLLFFFIFRFHICMF